MALQWFLSQNPNFLLFCHQSLLQTCAVQRILLCAPKIFLLPLKHTQRCYGMNTLNSLNLVRLSHSLSVIRAKVVGWLGYPCLPRLFLLLSPPPLRVIRHLGTLRLPGPPRGLPRPPPGIPKTPPRLPSKETPHRHT